MRSDLFTRSSTLGFSGIGGSSPAEPPWKTQGTGDDDRHTGPEKIAVTAAERELACIKAGGVATVTKGLLYDEVECSLWDENGNPKASEPDSPLTPITNAANAAAAALAAKTAAQTATPTEGGGEPAAEPPPADDTNWAAIAFVFGTLAVGGGLLYYASKKRT